MKNKPHQSLDRAVGRIRMTIRLAAFFVPLASGLSQSADWPASSASGLRPPSKARWSITYRSLATPSPPEAEKAGDAKPETGALPAKAEYQLNLPLGKAVITFKGGGEKVIYLVNDVTLTRAAGSDRILAEVLGPFSDPDGWFGRHYPGFSWISRETYDGVVELDGKKFYHFKISPVPPKAGEEETSGHGPPRITEDSEAWVDVETKRPYEFRQGNLIGLYRHEEPSGTPIPFAPEFKKALRIYYGYDD